MKSTHNDNDVPIPDVPIPVTTFVSSGTPDPFQGRHIKVRTQAALDARKAFKPPEPWETPPDWIDPAEIGLVRRAFALYGTRAAALVASLLAGATFRSACVHAGVSVGTVQQHREKDPVFHELCAAAWDAGFQLLEDELVQRALNGADDKGSIRALELALKSRDPNYRDQRTVDVTLRAAAANARQRVVSSRGAP